MLDRFLNELLNLILMALYNQYYYSFFIYFTILLFRCFIIIILVASSYPLWNCNGTRTHNHLVCKHTLNHSAKLAKWLNDRLQTKWLWVRVPLQSLNFQILRLFRARSSLTFRQLQSTDSL